MAIKGLESTKDHVHGATPEPSPDQVHRARLAVASAARDAEDCAYLLDALDLLPNRSAANGES